MWSFYSLYVFKNPWNIHYVYLSILAGSDIFYVRIVFCHHDLHFLYSSPDIVKIIDKNEMSEEWIMHSRN